MSALETWQRPAADDINPDALEYLFDGNRRRLVEVPWVRGAREPEPVNRQSPEYVRLETKIEVLLGQVDLLTSQLQITNCELGYAKALIAYRDDQLESLAEYRARAARAILGDVEREALRQRIAELEALIAGLSEDAAPGDVSNEADFKVPQGLSSADLYRAGRYQQKSVYVPLMPICYALVIVLAALVFFTLFY